MLSIPPVLNDLLHPFLARFEPVDGLLVFMAPVFLLAIGSEWWRLRRRPGVYDWRDSWASINLGGAYSVLDVVFVVLVVLPALQWVHEHRLMTFEMTPWRFVALYLGVEFCYYWFHRASHRIRWFWCAHSVHHGSEHMNFTTALRQSWLYGVAGNWLFYTPMVFIGFEPRWVLLALSINLIYQFFIHTQWVDRLPGPLEWLLNTPSHHRAHHGRNPRYIDHNYGGTLIVFDRLFGTFVAEDEPVDYGLVYPSGSYNPVWLNLHEWVMMVRDMRQPAPLKDRLKRVWGPPEWGRTPPPAAAPGVAALTSAPSESTVRPHPPLTPTHDQPAPERDRPDHVRAPAVRVPGAPRA